VTLLVVVMLMFWTATAWFDMLYLKKIRQELANQRAIVQMHVADQLFSMVELKGKVKSLEATREAQWVTRDD